MGRRELESFANAGVSGPEAELHFKFYRQATNKIAGISAETATFLRRCVRPASASNVRRTREPMEEMPVKGGKQGRPRRATGRDGKVKGNAASKKTGADRGPRSGPPRKGARHKTFGGRSSSEEA